MNKPKHKSGVFLYRRGKKFRWRAVGRNGKIVAGATEDFNRRAGALNNMRATRTMLLNSPIQDLT